MKASKKKQKKKSQLHTLVASFVIYIILCVLFYAKYGFTWDFLPMAVYSYLLILITLSDIQKHIIPNKLIIIGVIAAVLTGILHGSIIATLIGGAVGLLVMIIPAVFKAKVGMGDIKLGLLIGLMVGYPLAVMSLILPWIIGMVVVGVLAMRKRTKAASDIPFAVFLSVSAVITMLWGGNIWQMLVG